MEDVGIFSPRSKCCYKDRCVVNGCESKADKNLTLRFHHFPKPNKHFVRVENIFGNLEKVDQLKAWKIALKIRDVTPRMKVCSLHFKKDDYILPDVSKKRNILKKSAVPSCNLPASSNAKENTKENQTRFERRVRRSDRNEELKDQMIQGEQTIKRETEMQVYIKNEEEDPTGESTSEMFVEEATYSTAPLVKDAEVQVNTTDYVNPQFLNFVKNDGQLSTLTGIESFEILNNIVEIVKLVYKDKFEKNNVRMNTKDRVFMTYVKLKQNLSYSCLAIIFNCYSAKHCQRVFYDTVKILSKCLKAAIPWPSREEIAKNLPQCFEGFENVRVVLDCTEIFIKKPANLCCQLLTYSHYKGSQTCKIMTGVSPAGNITYISKPYGGRVTDSTIFQQSDLIKLLEPGDAIMFDQRFLIDEICEVNRWKCIRPPFLKDKKQFTKAESILTSKIATARVHIERSNQRIKMFKIVGSTMPVRLVPLLEDIFTVICATINMSSPILNNKKFLKP